MITAVDSTMRILVIGGTRFLGPAVVARLAAAGHEITVFHRGQDEVEHHAGVSHLHGDRARLVDFSHLFRLLAPDIVLDMAPYSEDDARQAVAAFRGVARRLVALSSQDVYRAYGRFHRNEAGPHEPIPYDEGAPLRERLYPYRGNGRGLDDYDKIPVERLVMSTPDLPGTVLRLPMVYGERDYQRRLFIELRRMDDGRPAILVEETFAAWRWSRAYVENAAAAIALAVIDDRAAGRVYNVGEVYALTYAEWLRAVAHAAGWPGEVVVVPDGTLPPSLRPPDGDYTQHLVADTTRIRHELGFVEPMPREEALRRAVAWERAQRAQDQPRPIDYSAEDALLAQLRAAPA